MTKTLKVTLALLVLMFSMGVGAFAASNLEEVKAYMNKGLKFTIDGTSWTPKMPPVTYEGSTYLPVRAVAEALGTAVDFDADTNTVILGEKRQAFRFIF